MKIIKLKIDDIKPYANNVKEHPPWQIEQIKKSIQVYGFNDPIAINENNEIIEGHGRLEALKQLGVKEIECIRLNIEDKNKENLYRIIHNQLTLNTDLDFDKISKELDTFIDNDFDLDSIGIDKVELNTDEEIEDDVLSLENEEEENKKYRCPNCEFEAVLNDFIKGDEK